MTNKPRVIVIGLDGATWNIIQPLVEQGKLPTIGKLMKHGTYGDLESTIPPVTAPAWVSFATGKITGNHGCFNFVMPKDGLDDLKPISTRDIKGDTFYKILYDDGKKYILINLPVSDPPLTDQITLGSLTTLGKNFVFPETLKDEIPELKDYRIVSNLSLKLNGKIEEFVKDVRVTDKHRFECAMKLFNKEWNLFFLLFRGTDAIQHNLYHKIIEKIKRNLFDDEVLKLYVELDSYIGWFVNNVPKDTSLILMSDHGFKVYEGVFYINEWLKREGYLKLISIEDTPLHAVRTREFKRYEKNKITIPNFILKIGAFLNQFIPMSRVYLKISKILPIKVATVIRPDLSKTFAFTANAASHGIYINRSAIKNYNIEYDVIRNEIIENLKNLKNPKNNKSLFKEVLKKEDIGGNNLQHAPDIILILDEYNISSSIVHQIFENHFSELCNFHDYRGIFCISGPRIKKNQEIKNAKIIDIAPTILHLFGSPIPNDMDGKVLTECFEENSELAKRGIVYQDVSEKARIKDKIKSLKISKKI